MQMVKLAFTVLQEENGTFFLHCNQPKFELHYVENKLLKFQKRCAKSGKPLIQSNVFLSVYLIE